MYDSGMEWTPRDTAQNAGQVSGHDDALTLRISIGVVGVGTLLAAAAVTVLRFANSAAAERGDIEATVGTLAFGLALAMPGILTLMARRGRPVLLLPAAMMLVPFSFLSFALVTLPLLLPAVLLFVAYYSRRRQAGDGVRDLVVAMALTLGAIASITLLFSNDAQRTYATSDMVVSTTIISYRGTVTSLAMTAAVLGLGWLGSTQGARS
jgi:hypothetical protein